MAELIRHELGRVLLDELQDPRIGFVTLTRVEVSPDLRTARAFVSVMGSLAEQRTCLRGLNSARQRVQTELGARLALRRTPELSFEQDVGVKQSLRMNSILSDLAREREEDGRPDAKPEAEEAVSPEETESDGR